VVAFRTTGLTDIVDHQVNGFLAEPFDFRELAAGIAWALSDKKLHADLCVAARAKAERCFEASVVANQHRQLYERKLAATGRTADIIYRPRADVFQ
jgi:glycosyltransferase involved in cell wall biosynthesis